jgi:hypothetical protein
MVLAIVAALCTVTVTAAEELDPYLRVLVEKGIITEEEAFALQAEWGAREKAGDEAPPPAPEKKSFADRFKPTGDIRMRYEGLQQDGSFENGRRDRFRIRIRAGFEYTLADWLKFGMELRNGVANDPVSNNITFDGAFVFKDINLAEGYLAMRPYERVGLIMGKFDAAKWWTVTDFQWDDDVTVEGLMTNFGLARGDGGFKGLDLVAYTYLLEEVKAGPDGYLFGGQLRSDFRMGEKNTLQVGIGFDDWTRPQLIVDQTLSGNIEGNKVSNFLDVNDQLISDFEIFNAFAVFKNKSSERWPFTFKAFYYKNNGARGIGADNDTGYFGRLQVGGYKKPGRLMFRYSYYYSEPDALFYVFTQSDTFRSSNIEGHRLDVRIGFFARSYFNITWYTTELAYGSDETLNRWQVDYIVRF